MIKELPPASIHCSLRKFSAICANAGVDVEINIKNIEIIRFSIKYDFFM